MSDSEDNKENIMVTTRTSLIAICAGLAITLLSACGHSDGSAPNSAAARADQASVPPQPAGGEGCAGVYGNPPFESAPSLQGVAASLYPVELSCPLKGGEYLSWEDAMGTPREACLQIPDHASPEQPLPLLVFLHGSLFPGDPQTLLSGMDLDYRGADLSGDPNRPGFILLMVEGRDKPHHYPFPDDHAWGYDNWYRNLDRSDPAINVDVATVDHFMSEVLNRDLVDRQRIFMSGWSNGAAMAILYALNTPGIAATAVYSNPDPFTDVEDPCAQAPFGNNLRPIMTVHNNCDIIGICTTGSVGMGERFAETLPGLELESVILSASGEDTDSCVARCEYSSEQPLGLLSEGALRHLIWPQSRNEQMYAFLRDRALPANAEDSAP